MAVGPGLRLTIGTCSALGACMKKILVAVDGSPPSLRAAQLAKEIADATGASLTLAHSVPTPILPGDVSIQLVTDVLKAETERGRILLAEAAKALNHPGLKALQLEGGPAEQIADVADRDGYDLVVVGSRGRNAVARVLLGSVADRLVHICTRPVLVTR
jgi:nucleotide-binding universal stress UspA family protein